MNQKYFLAVMSIRTLANNLKKRVKYVLMIDDTGLLYEVGYFDGDFQQFRTSAENSEIVYITKLNQKI